MTGPEQADRRLGRRVGAPVAAGAVVLVVLQILQSTIGSFNPRWIVTAFITAAVGLATVAVNRYRARRQEDLERQGHAEALQRALRSWPLEKAQKADPYRLGVFPPRRGDARFSPRSQYLERGVDSRLRDALRAPGVVVVFGPRRAGKSRTAFEAMRETRGDSKVIAPADEAGLQQVLDLELEAEDAQKGGIVLWLDGLERFVPIIDAYSLERLERNRATVVATIRTDVYDALLGASGPEGEAAKAIVARARAFEVPELSPDELRDAQALYQDVDFGNGFGATLSGTGKEELGPGTTLPPEQPAGYEAVGPWYRDRLLALAAAGALGALLAIGGIAATVGVPKPSPLSLGEQVDKIKSGATGSARQLLGSGVANFHGFGDPSYWFAFGPSEIEMGKALAAKRPLPADEIRIYDQRGGKLRQAFEFQPETPAARFKIRYDKDLDGDGEAELIGGYGFRDQMSEALMPFVVHWASGTGRYRISSLQTIPPKLVGKTPTKDGRRFVEGYQQPLTLTDGNVRVTGYRMQSFTVSKNPQLLIRGLVVKPKTTSLTGLVQVQASILRVGDQPTLIPCHFAAEPPTAEWRSDRNLQFSIEDAWNRFARTERCAPG